MHLRARRVFLAATTTALAAGVATAMAFPALADPAPNTDTTVTFDVQTGTLDIFAPTTAALGSGLPGADITGNLGPVTVIDSRATLDASWATQVTTTDFTTGASTIPETVAASDVDYVSGGATATVGTGTFTPGQSLLVDATQLGGDPVTAFSHSNGTGNNSATWNPALVVHVPLASVAGTYTGTVTHSVA